MDANGRTRHRLIHAEVPHTLVRKALLEVKRREQEKENEKPENYAEERVGETAEFAANLVQRPIRRTIHTRQFSGRGTDQFRSSFQFYESDTAQKRSHRPIRQARCRREVQSVRTKNHVSLPIKTRESVVKDADFVKENTKKAQETTQKMQQIKRIQKMSYRTECAASKAKATVKIATRAIERISMILKRVIAMTKTMAFSFVGGGSVAVVMVMLTVLVAALLSVFGIFSSNEASDGGRPLTDAIEQINAEFKEDIATEIALVKSKHNTDKTVLIYEGDMEDLDGTISNWSDVIGVYAMRVSMDSENAMDITTVTNEHRTLLRETFYSMNEVTYDNRLEEEKMQVTDEYGALILDENGNPIEETTTTLLIRVRLDSMDYRDGADMYRFHEDQNESLHELMKPEYYPLFAELLGDAVGDGGTYGFGSDIQPNLPPNALGAQIVEAAKRYIGRSYASMDCSKLARTAYKDCGLTSMNGRSSVGMAKRCEEMGVLFTDPTKLQAGDLIFFSRFDPKRGKDYCGDTKRCGTDKCRRWLHIHHVAIYINDEFLIDSTGGNNSVQIRKHWGMDTAKWKWVCFGRPTT